MSGDASQQPGRNHQTPPRASEIGVTDPAQEEDIRTKQALLTAIVVLLLFGAGFWLVQEFHKSVSAQQCLEQGRRNCPATEIKTR